MLRMIITPTPRNHDSNDVHWLNDKNERVGSGYQSKDDKARISLVRCPKCGMENYAMNVPSGECSWCPFNANTHE